MSQVLGPKVLSAQPAPFALRRHRGMRTPTWVLLNSVPDMTDHLHFSRGTLMIAFVGIIYPVGSILGAT